MLSHKDNKKVLSYKDNRKALSYKDNKNNKKVLSCAGAGGWRKVVLKFCGAEGSMSSCSGAGMHCGMRGVVGGG